MNQRLSRKEMKQDEFVATMGRGVDYASHHVRQIVLGVVAVTLVGAVLVAGRFWLQSREDKAQELLDGAIRLAEAPIDPSAPKPDDAETPSFADEATRRAKARSAFEQVRSRHSRSAAADVAGLYLASMALDENKPEEARELWQQYLADHPRDFLSVGARVSLLHLDRQQGKLDEVAAELRKMLDDAERPLPEDVVLWELAQTLEAQGKAEEAKPLLQRIADEFARSAYHVEAQTKLRGAGPALAR
jgi:tetratricopeptide (TPR) repeat protein